MKIIDTHSHLYLEEFVPDVEQVISSAQKENISHIILPNVDTETVQPLFELVGKYEGYLFPLMGLHPTSVTANYKEELNEIEKQLSLHTIYGIGEIGIDLYWDKTYKREQIFVFEQQLQWSKELGLPVSIHTRDAFPEVLESIYKIGPQELKGVFHSFTGTANDLEEVKKLENFLVGINGVVTFKNSNLSETLKEADLNKLVIETDAPYLSPVPYRGKRNEPVYLWNTAEKIAEIFNQELKDIAEITTRNALQLFSMA